MRLGLGYQNKKTMDYNVPDKGVMDTFTPSEHNELKAAVNSKMDKDKLVSDFLNPDNEKFPSALAVYQLVDKENTISKKGTLDGDENIRSLNPGIYVPSETFDRVDSNYPNDLGSEFTVVVYHSLVMVYDHSFLKIYISQYAGGVWSNWDKIANESWVISQIAYPTQEHTPVIQPDGATGYSIIVDPSSTDKFGKFTLTHDTGENVSEITIKMTLQDIDNDYKAIFFTPCTQLSAETPIWVNTFSPRELEGIIIKTKGDFPENESITYYYLIY